jgi:hypothetical protein
MDREDVFVDWAPVQERSRRLSVFVHPGGPHPAVVEVLSAQDEGMIPFESLSLQRLRSSTRVPPARRLDPDWEIEPLAEVPPEPENHSVIQRRRSSVVPSRLLPPIDLGSVPMKPPVPPRKVEMHEPEPEVEEPSVRPRSSIRVPQPLEPITVEKELVNHQPALFPEPASLLTALQPSAHPTAPDALTRPKPKPSTRPSVTTTRRERRESQAPVRGGDQQVKAVAPRPKRTSEVSKVASRPLTQVDPLQKRTAPASTKNKTPSVPPSRPSRGLAAPSQTIPVPAPVPEPVVIPRPGASIVPPTATSNTSAVNLSVVLRPSTESERVPDDMFERRKRDNYVAKPVGLDLTDHSTRGRGLDAVGSTSVNMSLNDIDPNMTLSTSMPGQWVENSSVIINRHERSRSISRPPPSPIPAKQVEPQGLVKSESGEDEDSEDTEVGEVLEPVRMKELTLSRQPDLTIEDLEHAPSSVRSFL